MQWYYANNGQRTGPISEEEFRQLVQRGIVHDETLVWQQGMSDWLPFAQVAAMLPPVLVSPAGGESETGAAFRQPAPAPAALRVPVRYGGFWIRVVARIIDGVILWFVSQILSALVIGVIHGGSFSMIMVRPGEQPSEDQLLAMAQLLSVVMLVSTVIAIVYEWFFLSRFSATPGKMALGLQVQRANRTKLSAGRIVARYFASVLSSLIFGIGYLLAAFDNEKRALHDHLCDTRVIRTR